MSEFLITNVVAKKKEINGDRARNKVEKAILVNSA